MITQQLNRTAADPLSRLAVQSCRKSDLKKYHRLDASPLRFNKVGAQKLCRGAALPDSRLVATVCGLVDFRARQPPAAAPSRQPQKPLDIKEIKKIARPGKV